MKIFLLRWQYAFEMANAYLAQFTDDWVVVANYENAASAIWRRIDVERINAELRGRSDSDGPA